MSETYTAFNDDEVIEPGHVMEDGTIFVGFSPKTGEAMYVSHSTSIDEKRNIFSARWYVANLDMHGCSDWRLPTGAEMLEICKNASRWGCHLPNALSERHGRDYVNDEGERMRPDRVYFHVSGVPLVPLFTSKAIETAHAIHPDPTIYGLFSPKRDSLVLFERGAVLAVRTGPPPEAAPDP